MTISRIALLCLLITSASGSALAFELGSCSLLQVDQNESDKLTALLIPVEAAVLSKHSQQADHDDQTAQSSLDALELPTDNSKKSSFDTNEFTIKKSGNNQEDSSIFDLGTDEIGFGDY